MLNIIAPNRDTKPWLQAINEADPSIQVHIWPDINTKAKMALCWQPPTEALKSINGLEVISSMGAGVDGLIDNPEIPEHIKITRLVDNNLKQDMFLFIRHCIEHHRHNTSYYQHSQHQRIWQPTGTSDLTDMAVGILGFGEIGKHVAQQLANEGFQVSAWKNSPGHDESIRLYSGENGLKELLKNSQILICLLPLTPATKGILNSKLFANLPKSSVLIQVGRGAHLNETDLLAALDCRDIGQAYLDVFSQEPLPSSHAFWSHEKVVVTPHIASITKPKSVVSQIVENYQNLITGKPLNNLVDRKRGY